MSISINTVQPANDERSPGLVSWNAPVPHTNPVTKPKPHLPPPDERVATMVVIEDRTHFRTYKVHVTSSHSEQRHPVSWIVWSRRVAAVCPDVECGPHCVVQHHGVFACLAVQRRWFMLAIYCCLNFMNSVTLITFSAVSTTAARYYDVSTTAINALVVVFAIAYIPGYPLASWVFMKHHTRRAILVGGAFTAVGSAVRLLSVESLERDGQSRTFVWLMVGQCIAALANPFFTNAPARISADWFADDERALATTIGAMFTPVGVALGQVRQADHVSHTSNYAT